MILSTAGITESTQTPVSNPYFWYDPGNSESYSGSGSTLFDLSGNGNNASISGAPSYTPGDRGYFLFDGSNDYIMSADVFNGSNDIHTLEVWVRPSSNDDCIWSDLGQNSIDSGYHFAGSQIFASGANNRITCGLWTGTVTYTYSDGSYLNDWMQIVRTYDGTNLRFYLNGVLVNTVSLSFTSPYDLGSSEWRFAFGAIDTTEIAGTTAGYFAGRYGTIRYYRSALSSGDVMKNYQSTLPIYSYQDPTIQSFTSTGTTTWTAPTGVQFVEYLVVGGGGGGGTSYDAGAGGGGGGGMVRAGLLNVIPGQTYSVTVGSGGAGGPDTRTNTSGTAGGSSAFGSITSLGGGAGQGSRIFSPTARFTGGIVQNGSVSAASGGGGGGGGFAGGGGGGAGGAGSNSTSSTNYGVGGSGIASSISGSTLNYGAGGNGGIVNVNNNNGSPGTSNTGNGGNAGNTTSANSGGGGNGGSGIVIIKYESPI